MYGVIIQVLGICIARYNWSFGYIVRIGRQGTQEDFWNSVSHVNHSSSFAQVDSIKPVKFRAFVLNVNFSDSSVSIPWQRHMRWQWLGDGICVGHLWKVQSKIPQWLKQFGTSWQHKSSEMSSPSCINVDFSDSSVPFPWQRHMRWQWLGDRICVGYQCQVESKIPQWLKQLGTCWQYKSSEMSSLRV